MNQTTLQGLITRLDEAKGRWFKELPYVLWVYHTTLWISINKTPFSLAFGTEVVIPVKIRLPIMQIKYFDESRNLN